MPVNFRLRAEEVDYIVEHSGASVLLVDPELDESLNDGQAQHRFVLGGETDERVMRFDAAPAPWSDPTRTPPRRSTTPRGTTARPKGVQITHRNIWVNAMSFGLHLRL